MTAHIAHIEIKCMCSFCFFIMIIIRAPSAHIGLKNLKCLMSTIRKLFSAMNFVGYTKCINTTRHTYTRLLSAWRLVNFSVYRVLQQFDDKDCVSLLCLLCLRCKFAIFRIPLPYARRMVKRFRIRPK